MLERTTISFFGRTNTGKSSLINALTNQDVSIVSAIQGTTTDPVKKVMELLPIGPVTIIDTPGLDDKSELGTERIKKAVRILDSTQIAVLVTDLTDSDSCNFSYEENLISEFKKRQIPFLIAVNKCDDSKKNPTEPCDTAFDGVLRRGSGTTQEPPFDGAQEPLRDHPSTGLRDHVLSALKNCSSENLIFLSAKNGRNINLLKNKLGELYTKISKSQINTPLVRDLIPQNSTVILVIPIDEAAPKDRLILPQQMVLRELLEYGAIPLCCTPETLQTTLNSLKNPPALVITDSQVFEEVSNILPESVPLTSFSILMARYKGSLELLLKGITALDSIKDGDTILISEGCTHHRQCGDIGSVKIPAWIKSYCKTEPVFEFSSGNSFPEDLSKYSLIVHCGGCMLNQNEMQSRIKRAAENNIPITNYGMLIAKIKGILNRSLAPLKI